MLIHLLERSKYLHYLLAVLHMGDWLVVVDMSTACDNVRLFLICRLVLCIAHGTVM